MTAEVVRSAVEKGFRDLIVGPIEELEVLSSNPADTYLTGILWPSGSMLSAAEDDSGVVDVATDDAESPDIAVPGYRAIRPCSIGLTFKVAAGATLEIDLGETARYFRSREKLRPHPRHPGRRNPRRRQSPSSRQSRIPA